VKRLPLRLVHTLPLFLLFVLGCGGSSKEQPATVSGKVTYKGTPLTMGTLEFHGTGNKIAATQIGPDGTYVVGDAPVGECTVVVKVVPPPKAPPGVEMEGAPKGTPVMVPPQYADPTKSGVKQTIAAGKSTVDIDLK
jgi:hypothetical protein